jgi:hypothetical protein
MMSSDASDGMPKRERRENDMEGGQHLALWVEAGSPAHAFFICSRAMGSTFGHLWARSWRIVAGTTCSTQKAIQARRRLRKRQERAASSAALPASGFSVD